MRSSTSQAAPFAGLPLALGPKLPDAAPRQDEGGGKKPLRCCRYGTVRSVTDIPVGRAGRYPAGGDQLAAAGSQLLLTGPFRTGFKSAQAKETASSNVGVGPGTSAADRG